MQPNSVPSAERRASSPTIFNLLQDQSLMSNNNNDGDENEEEKKQENEEKQETVSNQNHHQNHDDDDGDEAPNHSSNNAEDDMLGIDDEKTSETNKQVTDMMAVMQTQAQTQEIPEDEKQSPTYHDNNVVEDNNEECTAKPSEDQKVNFHSDEENTNDVLTTIKDDDDDGGGGVGDQEEAVEPQDEEEEDDKEDEDDDVNPDEDEDEREETEVHDDDDEDDEVEAEEEEEVDAPRLIDEPEMMTQASNAHNNNNQEEDEQEQKTPQHVDVQQQHSQNVQPEQQAADDDGDDDNETTTNTSNDEGDVNGNENDDAIIEQKEHEPEAQPSEPTPLQAPQSAPAVDDLQQQVEEQEAPVTEAIQNGDVNHNNTTIKPPERPETASASASMITMSDSQLFGTQNVDDNQDHDPHNVQMTTTPNESRSAQQQAQSQSSGQSLRSRVNRLRAQRKKSWPRETPLHRLQWPQYEPVLDVDMNTTSPDQQQNNQKTTLLEFVRERIDDHVLDRYNYRSFAVTAQLFVYPLSYASGQLRVMDRFYHRVAHHFHEAYLNQLRKQTYRATHENISDDVFYTAAIGGREVSRRSLLISTEHAPDVPWIDLDGSPLVPSAVAGIQTNGRVVVFFIRIPERVSEMMQKKMEVRLDTQCKQCEYASVRWHPSSAHTLLLVDKNIVRVFHIDRDWQSAKQVSTVNLNSLPLLLLSSPIHRALTSSPPIMKDKHLSGATLIANAVMATHYAFDASLLITLNGPHRKSYGLLPPHEAAAFENDIELQSKFQKELNAVNFITVHKFTKYRSDDPRSARAKYMQDVTDYEVEPLLIAHFDYEFLSVTTSKFDVDNGVDTNHTEIFQHCILLQPPSSSSSSSSSYFFATISKCIGLAKSCLTIWSLIGDENDGEEEFRATCVQRLFFATPSVNTLVTSMEYNRYSKAYILLSSTTFDPFQTDYIEARKQYTARVLKGHSTSQQKKLNEAFQQVAHKPVIYVDFTLQTPSSSTANVAMDDDQSSLDSAPSQQQQQRRHLFHSHILTLDWQLNTALKTLAPFISMASLTAETCPAPQFVPCRSLYRFVESSLIGQKSQLKNLRLYSRRQTIGLLQMGVFGFSYFEFFTPEQIKLRRGTPSKKTDTAAEALSAVDETAVHKNQKTSNEDDDDDANKKSSTQQLKQKLAQQVRVNAMALKEKQKLKQQKTTAKQTPSAISAALVSSDMESTPPVRNSSSTPTASMNGLNGGPRMASYLYAAPTNATHDDQIGMGTPPPPHAHANADADTTQPPLVASVADAQRTTMNPANNSVDQADFFRQLNATLQTQQQNLFSTMEDNFRRQEQLLADRIAAFEQRRQQYEQEQRQSSAVYAKTIEQLATQWNRSPPISHDDMQQVLTSVVTQFIMPKFGAFVMQMFKNFCTSWMIPTLEKHVHSNHALVSQEIGIKMKNMQLSFDEMLQKATAQITTATANAIHDGGGANSGGGMSAVLADAASAQIANSVSKQLQEVLQLLNKSVSSTLNKHLQKTMVQIQREMGATQTSMSTTMKTAVADKVAPQFKMLGDEMQSMQQQLKVLATTTADLETLRHHLPAPTINDSFGVFERKYPALPVPPHHDQHRRLPQPSYNVPPQNTTQSLPPYLPRDRVDMYTYNDRTAAAAAQHYASLNSPPGMPATTDDLQLLRHRQQHQLNPQPQQQASVPDSVREQLAQLQMQIQRLSSAHSSSQQLQQQQQQQQQRSVPPAAAAPRNVQSSWSVPAVPAQLSQTYDMVSPFVQSRPQQPHSFHPHSLSQREQQPSFADNLSRLSQNVNGNDTGNNQRENLINDLHGKFAQLMSEFQQKIHGHNSSNNGNDNDNNNDTQQPNDMDEDGDLGGGASTTPKRRQQTERLMQQYCDQNQPFQALAAMLKYKNYDLVIQLFDRFNMEALFSNGFARDLNKNKCVVNFDLLNQLIWFFTELLDDNNNDADDDAEAVVKYIEWITLLVENISAKDIDFDINVLGNTLNKVDTNLQRLSTTKSSVKSIKRATKYLSLLTEKWRNKIKK